MAGKGLLGQYGILDGIDGINKVDEKWTQIFTLHLLVDGQNYGTIFPVG